MIRYAVALVTAIALASVVAPQPAQADEVGVLPNSPWQAVDTGIKEGATGWTPDAPQTASGLSHIVSPTVAYLEWAADNPASALGTSLETADLGLAVEAGAEVTVDYEASAEGACDSGAVRVFVSFGTPEEANTGASPVYAAVGNCSEDGGTITLVVPDAGEIAYAGLVYDTSNGGVPGSVEFRNLMVGKTLVWFEAPPRALPDVSFEGLCDGTTRVTLANGEDATAPADFTVSVGGAPSIQLGPVRAGLTPEPILVGIGEIVVAESTTDQEWTHVWADPGDCGSTPAPGQGGSLPQTGSFLALLAAGGGLLLVVGVALMLLTWRRRRTFTTL